MTVNYLDMLNLIAADFHFARMFGLGHIDTNAGNDQWVYLSQYETNKDLTTPDLNSAAADFKVHFFMTLPTRKSDYRLPPVPMLTGFKYGVEVPDGNTNSEGKQDSIELTDNKGYAFYADERYIGLNKSVLETLQPFGPFYYSSEEFSWSDHTQPVFFGIKYKTPAIDGATEIIDLPDLLRDPNLIPSTTNPLYTDPSGSTSAKSENNACTG